MTKTMKTFTCKEGQGVCDKAFSGETAHEVTSAMEKHIWNATDDVHVALQEKLKAGPKDGHQRWLKWFDAEWEKKAE